MIDYMEVLGILGSLVAKHPQTSSLLMQTYGIWNDKAGELNKIAAEYQAAAAKATGPLDQAGIALQLLAMHPSASALVKQTVAMWGTRLPDLMQVLDELQNAANEAAKT